MKLVFAALMVVALIFTGCASSKVLTNPDTTFPLEVSAESPAFVFPISLHFGGSADKDAVSVALVAGVVAEFGASVISGQPVYDLVGNLSWTLGEAMRRNVNDGNFKMDGAATEVANELAGVIGKITGALASAGLIEDGFSFKYIIVLHSDGASTKIPKTVGMYAFGGMYEIETNTIVSYLETTVTMADNEATLLGQIPMEFNKIIKSLIEGK